MPLFSELLVTFPSESLPLRIFPSLRMSDQHCFACNCLAESLIDAMQQDSNSTS
ncbi:hypothetical protein ACVK1X_005230 [Pseudomonas sp. PvR086]